MSTLKILIMASFLLISLSHSLLARENQGYLLMINIADRKLVVYEGVDADKKELGHYLIAVPKNEWLPLPLSGEVVKIEINPFWYPTEKTRAYYLRKKRIELPKVVRPGDPKNAMGKAKILVKFENFSEPIRIHGTNDPQSIGKRITRGCIRMNNKDILSLIEIIKFSKVRVVIEKPDRMSGLPFIGKRY